MTFVHHIRRIEDTDVAEADHVLRRAFETEASFAPQIARYRRLAPRGLYVTTDDTRIVGVGGVFVYGDVGIIGLMAVEPSLGRLGIAGSMLAHLEAHAHREGVRGFVLDATARGQGLYTRHGYEAAGGSIEYVATWHGDGGYVASTPSEVELDEIAAYDAGVFGIARGDVLTDLATGARVIVERSPSGAVVGYLFAHPVLIGPFAADTPDVAARMLGRALRLGFDRPPRMLVPSVNEHAEPLCRAHALTPVRTLTHMRKGETAALSMSSRLYGKASFAFG
jgi:predicted N-acetyltransferase YhbS